MEILKYSNFVQYIILYISLILLYKEIKRELTKLE